MSKWLARFAEYIPETSQSCTDSTDIVQIKDRKSVLSVCNKGISENNTEPALTPEDQSDIQEAIEERAAIQEYEGGLSRPEAEQAAKSNMRVYHYRLTDNPDTWLTMIAPGCELEEVERSLKNRFGEERVLDVRNSESN